MITSLRRTLGRLGRWPRWCLAGCCLLLAAASAVQSAQAHRRRPPDPAGVAVVVAARDLPAGHRLGAGDLRIARYPPTLRPAGALTAPRALTGRVLAGAVSAGEPIPAVRLVGRDALHGLPAGTLAVSVGVDRDVGTFVRAGDRVDLVAVPVDEQPVAGAAGGTRRAPAVLARRALVLAVLDDASGSDSGADSGAAPGGGVALVLATDRDAVLQIARARPVSTFSVVGDPP